LVRDLNLRFVSVHPEFVQQYFAFGIFKRAAEELGIVFSSVDLRDFAVDKHGSIDAKPYGGGEGMIMRAEPLAAAVKAHPRKQCVIVTDPKGISFSHDDALELSNLNMDLCFICGRFSGMDERFLQNYADKIYSIGSFVVSGGELPSLLIADAVVRQWVLKEAANHDSFAEGFDGKMEYPLYKRPEVFEGLHVPDVLLSGNHAEIKKWQLENLK
jgi:tRNA (guanine37-N1)-methyltransferase